MSLYITFNNLLDLVRSNLKVYILYRPIPGMGDGVMVMPAITGIRKKYGKNVIIVMMGLEYVNTVFEHNDCLDFIVPYTSEEVTSNDDINKYNETLDKSFLKNDYLHILKLDQMDCNLYRLEHPCPAGHHESNTLEENRRSRVELFSEACGVKFDMSNYNFKLHDYDLDANERLNLPDRYVVVGIRSSTVWKDYRFMKWLVRKLSKMGKRFDFQVVTMDEKIQFDIKGVRGLVGQSLTDLYGVLAKSILTISNDSGYAHVAGALDVPVYGLFGPTPPHLFLRYPKVKWLPRFERCDRQFCWYLPCKHRPCLSIHPNRIIKPVIDMAMEYDII